MMEIGDIYKLKYDSGNEFINLYEGEENMVRSYISINDSTFWSFSNVYCGDGNIVDITDEEKLWLLKCIEQDRFIPFSQINLLPFKFGR